MCRSCHRSRWLCAKVHLRRLPRSFRCLEVRRVLLVAGKPRVQAVRELQHIGVVILQRVVIALALDGNPVLRPRQLILQAQKILVRLQLRIILHDQQQPPDRSIQLPVRGHLIGRRLRRKQRRPRLGDVSKNRHFLLRISLHRLHQVRNQIRAPLQHDVHLRPRRLHRLILRHQLIAHAHVLSKQRQHDHHQHRQYNQALAHVTLLNAKIVAFCSAASYELRAAGNRFARSPQLVARSLLTRQHKMNHCQLLQRDLTPPDPASCPPPPSPVPPISDSAQTPHPPSPTSGLSYAPEYQTVRRTRRHQSPAYPPAQPPLPSSIPLPHRPAQSAYDERASQKPAATAATAPTLPPRFLTPSATAAAAGSSSPAAHTPPAPDVNASGSPTSSERLLPTARDSAAAYPKIRWRKDLPTAASLPHSSAAARDASASPTIRSPEPAPRSMRRKSRAARTADSRPSSRKHNLPPPPTHKESPPADSFPTLPASARQTRQSVFPEPFRLSLSNNRRPPRLRLCPRRQTRQTRLHPRRHRILHQIRHHQNRHDRRPCC